MDNRFWGNRYWDNKLSVKNFLRDIAGAVLVEYTVVFPLFIVVVLGTVDVTYMLYEWGLANKAAYRGARTAVVSAPVAVNITSPAYDATLIGQPCFNTAGTNVNCPSLSTVCTPGASNGTCTNGFAWDEAAFTNSSDRIFDRMKSIFPRLTRQNVQISYQTNNLGFVGRPGGLPMNVTVSIQCMTHQFFFIDALMRWAFTPPAGCPVTLRGPAIPGFASTLQSEDMSTN